MVELNLGEQGAAQKAVLGASIAAAAAIAFLVWLIYFAVPSSPSPAWAAALPLSDALCNAASAVCAIAGFAAIRSGRRRLHQAFMLAALFCSALFLAGYVVFHHFHGETHFQGAAWVRAVYLCLLASHILLSFAVLPLLFVTVAFAGLGFFQKHRRLARWTLPLWLYVSVTGVLVYLFLRSSY